MSKLTIFNAFDFVHKFIGKHKYESFVSVAFTLLLSVIFCKRKKCKSIEKKPEFESKDDITEVLFFSDRNSICLDHINNQLTCLDDCGYNKLEKLVEYLDSATTSLDVCVYTITSLKLGEAVLRKFRQGVVVRVITDESMSYGDGTQIPKFRKNGIRVRVKVSTNLMHHKFAIVDRRVLINGSFNWTQQAVFGNWENVIITTTPRSLVEKYCNQFDELWQILN